MPDYVIECCVNSDFNEGNTKQWPQHCSDFETAMWWSAKEHAVHAYHTANGEDRGGDWVIYSRSKAEPERVFKNRIKEIPRIPYFHVSEAELVSLEEDQ